MLYKIIIITFLLLVTSCKSETKESVYENSFFKVILNDQCNKLVCIELINIKTSATFSAIPELVVYDDKIPVEGGLVNDYNRLIDNNIESDIENLYSCDSVYSVFTDSINLVFGQESRTVRKNNTINRRFDLGIYNSKLSDFMDGNYTLYAVEE